MSKESSSSEIKPLKSEASEIIEESFVQEIHEILEEKEVLPSEFYICYECDGKGQVIENSCAHLCHVCKGKGKLNHQHKYIQRLKYLFEKQTIPVKEEKKVEKIVEKVKEEKVEEPVRKGSYVLDKDYEIIASEVNKKDTVEINKLFTMRFEIKNVGRDWKKTNIYVIESGKKDGKRVSALKSGDKMVIELGPFVCKDESLLEKTFSLFYQDGEELVRFGHKFGFTVKGAKKIEVPKNNIFEKEKERVRDLKAISGSQKSEEYLMLKLKSLGIDVLNLGMDEEMVLEIISQIK